MWCGCAIGLHVRSVWIGAGVALAVAGVAAGKRTLRVWCAIVVIGILVAGLRVAAADPAVVEAVLRDAGAVDIAAAVDTEPQLRERQSFGGLTTTPTWRARATLISIRVRGRHFATSIPVTLEWVRGSSDVEVGCTVSGTAVLHGTDVTERAAYRVVFRSSLRTSRAASRAARITNRIRHSLADLVRAHDPGARTGATLLPGLVLGDTSAQSRELADDLRTSGLSHLTAVSGANVAIVIGAVLWLLQRTRIRRRYRHLVLAGLLVAFVAIVQPQPSVMRAAAMGAIALYALASGTAKHSSAALWLSVIVLLLIDPFMAWQFGFGLSVAATAGLIVLQPMLAERLPSHPLLGAILITVAAQIATLPLLLLMGAPPTWLSIPANVLAGPLVAPATVCGFVATALASAALLPLPLLSPVLTALAWTVAWPGVWAADLIAAIAHTGAGSALAVSPFASAASSAVFIGVVALLWTLRHRRALVVLMFGCYFLLTTCLAPLQHRWPPEDWWYAMCDVGQGDASAVRTGTNSAVLIDAGPDAGAIRRCLRRLGIDTIDALVLTHFHADHVEGVRGVVSQATVRAAFASPLHDPLIEYQRVDGWLDVAMQDISRGDRFRVGAVEFDVLAPEGDRIASDPNNASVVILARTPHGSVLLMGDADADAQARLPAMSPDVLKVPHHGSRYQLSAYLTALRARLALVSVGAGNDYGHPAPSTVGLLREAGSLVLRTDRQGGIAVLTRGGGLTYAVEHG